MEYNHNRGFSDFEYSIDVLHKHGFNPIAVTQMYFEEVYVFETDAEAQMAYSVLEKDICEYCDKKLFGFWYGKEAFEKEVAEYESLSEFKVLIYWLNKN
jgi:hypothetical protein